MISSRVNTIPDFSKLDIPESCLSIKLSDQKIFQDVLNAKRAVEPAAGPAQKGDYVLVEMTPALTAPRKRQIHLGKNRFPEYEAALIGRAAGDKLEVSSVPVTVLSVKRPRDMELTDENIAALALEGIYTLSDYRQHYIGENGGEIAENIFHTILSKLLDQLVDTMDYTLDEDEVKAHNDQQREMLSAMFHDYEERIIKAYSGKEPKTLEECEALFARDNQRTFITMLLGMALARRDRREISEDEMAECLKNAAMMYDKTEEELKGEQYAQCVAGPFYLQYAIGELRRYFLSRVRYVTETD